MPRFQGGSEEVEDEEAQVPENHRDIDEETCDLVEDAHVHWFGRFCSLKMLSKVRLGSRQLALSPLDVDPLLVSPPILQVGKNEPTAQS